MTLSIPEQNRFKQIISLRHRGSREVSGQFLVEGTREISAMCQSGYDCLELWVAQSRHDALEKQIGQVTQRFPLAKSHVIPDELYEKAGYRLKTEGLLAVCNTVNLPLPQTVGNNALFLVADQLEKPGNIGTLFRIADAFRLAGIIILGDYDVHHLNVIRNSRGAFFYVPFYLTTDEFLFSWIQNHGLALYLSSPEGNNSLAEMTLSSPAVMVFGSEHGGLSSIWDKYPSQYLTIPMQGQHDSLNVAVSAGICAYAWRQQHA